MRDSGWMCYAYLVNNRFSILARYKDLMTAVDKKTAEVSAIAYEIPCKNKCYECCQQLFPVSFVEAYYISEGLKATSRGLRRDRARVAEKIRNKMLAHGDAEYFAKRGVNKQAALNTHSELAHFLQEVKLDCPALEPKNPAGACTIYDLRNHDCRVMGFSFDKPAKTIVGCFRFNSLKYLAPKLMDFSFRYPDKMLLDREMIIEVTGGTFTPNVLYYTTMCGPLLKDYAEQDWIKFFSEKGVPVSTGAKPDEYWVVIDT